MICILWFNRDAIENEVPRPVEMVKIYTNKTTSTYHYVEMWEFLFIVDRNKTLTATLEDNLAVPLKLKISLL